MLKRVPAVGPHDSHPECQARSRKEVIEHLLKEEVDRLDIAMCVGEHKHRNCSEKSEQNSILVLERNVAFEV